MPTYEYLCDACKFRFEQFQSFSEKPLSRCRQCGASIRKVISGGLGVIFKGSGFYTTDYRSSSQGDDNTESSTQNKTKNKTSDVVSPNSNQGNETSNMEKKKTQ